MKKLRAPSGFELLNINEHGTMFPRNTWKVCAPKYGIRWHPSAEVNDENVAILAEHGYCFARPLSEIKFTSEEVSEYSRKYSDYVAVGGEVQRWQLTPRFLAFLNSNRISFYSYKHRNATVPSNSVTSFYFLLKRCPSYRQFGYAFWNYDDADYDLFVTSTKRTLLPQDFDRLRAGTILYYPYVGRKWYGCRRIVYYRRPTRTDVEYYLSRESALSRAHTMWLSKVSTQMEPMTEFQAKLLKPEDNFYRILYKYFRPYPVKCTLHSYWDVASEVRGGTLFYFSMEACRKAIVDMHEPTQCLDALYSEEEE